MKPNDILNFWFGHPQDPNYGKERKIWFKKDPNFDQTVKSRFLPTYTQASTGNLAHWQTTPAGCLALILLLDQFPRNMFRGHPQAFATDDQALAVAKHTVSQNFDQQLLPVQRWFIYLPFEHSENLADQQQALDLFATLEDDPQSQSAINYAQRHYDVIQRFGRFPHRNAILGRTNTPEEEAFLQTRGSSF